MSSKREIILILIVLIVFFIGGGAGYFLAFKQKPKSQASVIVSKDKYINFLFEVYKIIQENYWDKISDDQLVKIYQLGVEKLIGQPQSLKANDKNNLEKMLTDVLGQIEDKEKKKEFTASLADVVLANLKPFGRSRLYSKKQETELKNTVQNINPDIDQYQVLDVAKNASDEDIKNSHQAKLNQLTQKEKQATNSAEKEEITGKLNQVEDAYKILADNEARQIYDQSGVEPTIDYKLIRQDIFYIHIKKFSPTTLEELKRVTEKVDNVAGLDSLIIDLQDNIGGAIDLLPYFLGPFIGQDQYAYQFFSKNEKTDFKTKTGWLASLVRYKKVVVLINNQTQSSAEIMASVLKKYNVGVLVGTTTKGWGTIERVFPIENRINENESFSIFLVHSLTLQEDGEPIEGRGVEPMININDSDWENQLKAYFYYEELVEAVKEVIVKPSSL